VEGLRRQLFNHIKEKLREELATRAIRANAVAPKPRLKGRKELESNDKKGRAERARRGSFYAHLLSHLKRRSLVPREGCNWQRLPHGQSKPSEVKRGKG